MLILAAATALLGIGLSLAFAQSISRPIRAATAIAGRVARGNFSDAIVSTRRDELGELLQSLAEMQASLRAKAEAELLASQAKDRAHTEKVAKTEGELRRTRSFLDTVVENIPAMLFVKDARDHRFVLLNRAGEELLGVPRDTVIGKNDYDFFPKEEADYFVSRDREVLESGRLQIIEQEPIHTPHNGLRLLRTKKIAISDDKGEPQYLLGVCEDITERKQAEAQIEHMSRHDALTDLPNGRNFTDRLAFTLDRAATMEDRFAVLCIDLDRFKEINDVFGHRVGDEVLREVSRRLRATAEGAFVARIGGDEFALIAAEGPQPSGAAALANRLLAAAAEEIEIAGQRFRVGLSIGVAIFPVDGCDATTLVGNADAALHRAKAEGRGTIRFFERDMDVRLRERRALQHDLKSAIDRGELCVHYQPQAQAGGKIVGFEALIRWLHPSRGWVAPNAFIPLAEESGLIVAIGEWVLREACREAASWPAQLQIAVNLSPAQFRDDDLPRLVHSVLLATGLAADRLELEVTESVLIGDFSRALSILRRLKSLGVQIAMDDFGSGYSSLSYLQSFPFDKLKIDQVFISNLERNPQSKAIVRGVIGLARGLDLPVLAEGVETKSQLAFLQREGCQEVQGYLIGRPQPIDHYADVIGRRAKKASRAIASRRSMVH
jgi:diguanylate cyclase (GGDEF)-like protein/PAS domain S-box-containing protein